jgi:hypothetical protein
VKNRLILGVAAGLVIVTASAYAGWFSKEEMPPANAKPLSEIIKSLEDQGHKNIEKVGFESGVWEVEVHQAGGKEVEFHVDPMTAKIVKTE